MGRGTSLTSWKLNGLTIDSIPQVLSGSQVGYFKKYLSAGTTVKISNPAFKFSFEDSLDSSYSDSSSSSSSESLSSLISSTLSTGSLYSASDSSVMGESSSHSEDSDS